MILNISKIYPILLAGGLGARLWPLSRKSYPKQFTKLISDVTLFQSCIKRLSSSEVLEFESPITLTNSDYGFIVREQFREIGFHAGPILIEPEAKNTAAAILAASIFTHSKDQESVLLVASSDHVIPNTKEFHRIISNGLLHVENGKMVTFGIEPTHPETGYGYLKLSTNYLDSYGTANIEKFIEKPDISNARQMLETGDYLWNAGIFLFSAKNMIDAFRTYNPVALDLVYEAVNEIASDLGFLHLLEEPWSKLENISIDYAIMEKAKNLVAIPYKSKWTDLGGWDAVWSESTHDKSGNATSESSQAVDCTNTLLRSESKGQQVIGLGLDNIMAIAMHDAVLVAHKDRAQDVKYAIDLLKSNNVPQAEEFSKKYRRWGWFENILSGSACQVKHIYVKKGATIKLQNHNFGSDNLIIVSGSAKVFIDDDVKILSQGDSVFIPNDTVYSLENNGEFSLEFIKVQIGDYSCDDHNIG